ncbi:hypothetical protein GCM10009612_17440 [Streptomyces beijiangensis]
MRKMLRRMASGDPVQVTGVKSYRGYAELASLAEQFGYAYSDILLSNGLRMQIVPDPSPQARARAAQNWAQYPDAADGVALPPLAPDDVGLLEARIKFDVATGLTEKQRIVIAVVGSGMLATAGGLEFGADATSFAVAGVCWITAVALIPVGVAVGRRFRAKNAILLEAAGYALLTEASGRTRYVPPGRQVPGHGNPFG